VDSYVENSIRKLLHSELLEKRISHDMAFSFKKYPVLLIVDSIRSVYNIGSIFRSADSAGIEGIMLCGYSPKPPREDITKTALGADETVAWSYHKDCRDAIGVCKENGYTVMAVELTDNGITYDALQPQHFPLALIVGNEVSGIDDEILSLCDGAIEIPMYGVKHSLNVAVASGIIMYEAVRSYRSFTISE
jgi:23S rRNA (guanosine2251-2'-O)-methyltransferase